VSDPLRTIHLLSRIAYEWPIAVSDPEADEVVEECGNCGSQMLGVYIENGRCPDCRE
jgi:hypothetical protein